MSQNNKLKNLREYTVTQVTRALNIYKSKYLYILEEDLGEEFKQDLKIYTLEAELKAIAICEKALDNLVHNDPVL